MTTVSGLRTRAVRKVEPPRPRKSTIKHNSISEPISCKIHVDSVEKLLLLMSTVNNSIANQNFDESLAANIIALCSHLKIYGPLMEDTPYLRPLDESFLVFRKAVVNDDLDYSARLCLLEIVELREQKWKMANSDIVPYYQSRCSEMLTEDNVSNMITESLSQLPLITALNTEELVKRSGKFTKPMKLSGKNYCKDEIVIRNSDSGKVMGIKGRRVHMIEQLSETIISFQRVQPTAKERLVQITGATEDNIQRAAQLIEETIRNNTSPVPEFAGSCGSLNSESDEGMLPENEIKQEYKYKHKVQVNGRELIITGTDYNYVTVAKTVLDDFFSKLRPGSPVDDNFRRSDNVFHPQFDLQDVSNDRSAYQNLSQDINSTHLDGLDHDIYTDNISTVLTDEFDVTDDDVFVADRKQIPLKYNKDFFEYCAQSSFSKQKPNNWQRILKEYPNVVRSKKIDE